MKHETVGRKDPSDFFTNWYRKYSCQARIVLKLLDQTQPKKTEQGTALWNDANAGIIRIVDGPRRRLEQLVNRVHGEAAATVGHGRAEGVYVQMEVEVRASSSTLRTQSKLTILK